ncbi:hypothetical protein KNP414_05574 [Paenibacillus mucilaginosus KNP414]|uniref:Uncharacterized protein n=1 Tax=Paenibacillus mucilaginosus (strain KNP414) TaxID=1036673 RepID=F8FK57_PAEMK|nr:hypothetical protein KNP414_05574 [Paenibacillus mucilaginosus KNP414]
MVPCFFHKGRSPFFTRGGIRGCSRLYSKRGKGYLRIMD